jgi:nucleotide-binding universal stress UspA family protein
MMMDRLLTTILLVTDCSTDAPLAARGAVDLATKTGAALHLVHTWLPVSLDAYDAPGMKAAYIDQDCFEAARGVLATSTRLLEGLGATVSGQYLRIGRAAEEISALGTMLGADLIVVGSGGPRVAQEYPLGADAEEIVRVANCPVLVVRGNSRSWPPVRIVVGDDGARDAAHRGFCRVARPIARCRDSAGPCPGGAD